MKDRTILFSCAVVGFALLTSCGSEDEVAIDPSGASAEAVLGGRSNANKGNEGNKDHMKHDGMNHGGSRFAICHIPPGNPSNAHTICVGSQSAVDAHLTHHGDTEGPCEGSPTPSVPEQACEPEAQEPCVQLCHSHPSKPEKSKTLCVEPEEVAKHLGHGDSDGECQAEEPAS